MLALQLAGIAAALIVCLVAALWLRASDLDPDEPLEVGHRDLPNSLDR